MAYVEQSHTATYSVLDANNSIGRMELSFPVSGSSWFGGGNSLDEVIDFCGVNWTGFVLNEMAAAIQDLCVSPIKHIIIGQHFVEDTPPGMVFGENQKKGIFEVYDVNGDTINVEVPGMLNDHFEDVDIKYPDDTLFPDHDLVKFRKEITLARALDSKAEVVNKHGVKLAEIGKGWKYHRESPKAPSKPRG